jgi:hypothetical protein
MSQAIVPNSFTNENSLSYVSHSSESDPGKDRKISLGIEKGASIRVYVQYHFQIRTKLPVLHSLLYHNRSYPDPRFECDQPEVPDSI